MREREREREERRREGSMYVARFQMDRWATRPRDCVLIREVSLFERLICTQKHITIGTSETVLIREVSLFQRCIYDLLYMYVCMLYT